MGKQTARLYYQGKDHKDIVFHGMSHDAMYIGSQLVWKKIREEQYFLFMENPKLNYIYYVSKSGVDVNVIFFGRRRLERCNGENAYVRLAGMDIENGFYFTKDCVHFKKDKVSGSISDVMIGNKFTDLEKKSGSAYFKISKIITINDGLNAEIVEVEKIQGYDDHDSQTDTYRGNYILYSKVDRKTEIIDGSVTTVQMTFSFKALNSSGIITSSKEIVKNKPFYWQEINDYYGAVNSYLRFYVGNYLFYITDGASETSAGEGNATSGKIISVKFPDLSFQDLHNIGHGKMLINGVLYESANRVVVLGFDTVKKKIQIITFMGNGGFSIKDFSPFKIKEYEKETEMQITESEIGEGKITIWDNQKQDFYTEFNVVNPAKIENEKLTEDIPGMAIYFADKNVEYSGIMYIDNYDFEYSENNYVFMF